MESRPETIWRPTYPFTAIVGQSNLKLALILNAIDPSIGGVLLAGPKGTGKSLIVRSFVEILPDIESAENCIFNCNPEDPTNMCYYCYSRFLKDMSLPKIRSRMRVVQIPISATEDRVIGTLDVEKAVREGLKALQLGLLAKANQNILYIDEVNILPDHLVDSILDSASSGWNFVEREGISISHPSRFILVGTMNPEEGILRAQILDRFGVHVYAENLMNPKERMEVVRRNGEFTKNPLAFCEKYEQQQEELRKKIEAARKLLPRVNVPQNILESIAKVCTSLELDGYRPDIVTLKAARALAALNGRNILQSGDVLTAAELVLGHRTRRSGGMSPPSKTEIHDALESTPIRREILSSKLGRWWRLHHLRRLKKIKLTFLLKCIVEFLIMFLSIYLVVHFSSEMLCDFFQISLSPLTSFFEGLLSAHLAAVLTALLAKITVKNHPIHILDLSKITTEQMLGPQKFAAYSDEAVRFPSTVEYKGKEKALLDRGQNVFGKFSESMEPSQPINLQRQRSQRPKRGKHYTVGKRAKVVTSSSQGRYVWHQLPKDRPWDIALGPTIRAAAPYQPTRKLEGLAIAMKPQDIRVKRREYRAPFSIILLVDMSWSMTSSISNLSRAIRSLHRSVYRRRDRVGLVIFKGTEASTLQEPTTNLDLVVKKLWSVKASGFTPMALGMLKAWKALKLEKQRNKDTIQMLILISDGITNIPLKQPPITRRRRVFVTEAQSDALDVARLLRNENIRIIIINISHSDRELSEKEIDIESNKRSRPYTPTEFLIRLSKVTKGSYYGLRLGKEIKEKKGGVEERPEDWFYFETR